MNTPPAPTASAFSATRWTLVQRARGDSPQAQAALGELCESYYQPVFRFLQREGRTEDAARELTHEFFARLRARDGFASADPARGRFRSVVLGRRDGITSAIDAIAKTPSSGAEVLSRKP